MIYEFDPVIYPLRVWVCINPDFEDIKANFYAINNDNEKEIINNGTLEPDRCTIARCIPVSDKKDGQTGVLVIIYRTKALNISAITHEASHITDFFCDELGIAGRSFDNGEATAYITGWVAKCIDEVKRKKK